MQIAVFISSNNWNTKFRWNIKTNTKILSFILVYGILVIRSKYFHAIMVNTNLIDFIVLRISPTAPMMLLMDHFWQKKWKTVPLITSLKNICFTNKLSYQIGKSKEKETQELRQCLQAGGARRSEKVGNRKSYFTLSIWGMYIV